MYEARQNKEKVSRRIEVGGMAKQRIKINDSKILQFLATYTLLITGAENWAVTESNAQNVVNQIANATYLSGKGLQGGGYLVVISTPQRDITLIRDAVANTDHNVTVIAGYHYKDYL